VRSRAGASSHVPATTSLQTWFMRTAIAVSMGTVRIVRAASIAKTVVSMSIGPLKGVLPDRTALRAVILPLIPQRFRVVDRAASSRKQADKDGRGDGSVRSRLYYNGSVESSRHRDSMQLGTKRGLRKDGSIIVLVHPLDLPTTLLMRTPGKAT
jgi:hypothetical protein